MEKLKKALKMSKEKRDKEQEMADEARVNLRSGYKFKGGNKF